MNKKKTLAERHALKRLEKVEENQRKAYEKKQNVIALNDEENSDAQ